MSLTQFQTDDRVLRMLQTSWASDLNPILQIPFLNGVQLTNVSLINGVNSINHLLQRTQQGWWVTDINAAATLFRSAPFNSTTLTLTSNAACVANLWVF